MEVVYFRVINTDVVQRGTTIRKVFLSVAFALSFIRLDPIRCTVRHLLRGGVYARGEYACSHSAYYLTYYYPSVSTLLLPLPLSKTVY